MKRCIGVIGIIVEERKRVAPKVNAYLNEYGEIIIGRLGVPYKARGINIITIIVDGTTDEIGALTGKLGMLKKVKVKSTLIRV
ncbi:iron-only hydrogenase system regulator [bacterium]|nr:iron-only hydrogenase system regulator [bacterium]MBU4561102.1 iron-only hydrogenase system regulator [bacterium]MCG2676445.1 iron-only hydrogenase system regulator [bacterium]MCG2678306.1 iron-only hydrogenase system regulator [bacterium]